MKLVMAVEETAYREPEQNKRDSSDYFVTVPKYNSKTRTSREKSIIGMPTLACPLKLISTKKIFVCTMKVSLAMETLFRQLLRSSAARQ